MLIEKKKDLIIHQPKNGWKAHTWYLVDAAYGTGNPVHKSILFTGFLSNKGNPGGYSFITPANCLSHNEVYEAKYIKPIKELYTYKIGGDDE